MEIYCIKNLTNSVEKRMDLMIKYCLIIASTFILIAAVQAQSDTSV